ncbi:hypothetical protein [Bosea sp. 124]|uniref:hypothetical protein n=1 Tax=Bosea sp. 124 TaxID=2135642 RepID=UPI000D3839B2|nr:hypothetical protein [Bosea sp. 124]PTM38755.1 hypothetical protein C8D03_0228 [Bosea sp. 124]
MFRKFAATSLASLAIGAAALAAASVVTVGPAEAFGPRYESEAPAYGWRPPPPAVHGYWGRRRWQHYNDGYGFRPPPPRYGYGYGHGWR